MNYYKVYKDNEEATYLGVASSFDLRYYQEKNNIFLITDESKATCILIKNRIYLSWSLGTPLDFLKDKYQYVVLFPIAEKEYRKEKGNE